MAGWLAGWRLWGGEEVAGWLDGRGRGEGWLVGWLAGGWVEEDGWLAGWLGGWLGGLRWEVGWLAGEDILVGWLAAVVDLCRRCRISWRAEIAEIVCECRAPAG